MKLGQYFTLAELCATSQKADNTPPQVAVQNLRALVVNVLDPLRELVQRPIKVTSGYRSPAVNHAVGGAENSQHVLGQAADIVVDGMTPLQVVQLIVRAELPFDQVIEEYGRWVHVSYSSRHRRDVRQARAKASGGTEYLPLRITR